MLRMFKHAVFTALAIAFSTLSAFAAAGNPHTGDTIGRYMWLVYVLLGVSLLVIIIIAILSGKKKK